ncbi:retrovirus-related pol polyprotein from transposon TNT 1-94 [Tanacetum coccineum]
MLNGLVLSKHFWTDAVRIACYTQNRSIIVKSHDKTSYEIFRERNPDISYFYVFGCLVFIHNHKDHLGKIDAKADDGYFLGYSSFSKAFRFYNIRRQQIEETYHVTFNESMEAIRFTNTSVDEIGINDSSRYPPDEFQEDDPSRQYQVDSDVSYYIIPDGRSLIEITQENHVSKVIAPTKPEIPHTKDDEGPPDLLNTEGTREQNVQNDQMITQPTKVPSGNNTEVLGSITEPLVPDVTLSHIINQAFISMLTRSMAAKLTAASASECLFADFLSKIEPKMVFKALKHPRWIGAIQEGLNQFYKNKVWTLVPLPYGKIAIGSKWVFRNKKDKHGTTTKNKARLVAQGYSQEEGIDYDETFAPPCLDLGWNCFSQQFILIDFMARFGFLEDVITKKIEYCLFDVVVEFHRSSDEEITPANDRFSKADGYHAVPPPIIGNFLTPRADISFAEGIGFKKIKACFVCKSTDHLIKDCDFYAKKSPEPKLKTVVNTGQRVVKPVWDNAKRVNHQKFSNKLKYPQTRRTFVPKGVLTKTGLINPVRPNGKRAVHTVSTASTARPVGTARPFAPKIAQTGSAIRPIYPRMDNVRPRASYSPIKRSYYTKLAFRPKNLKQDVKTSGVKNMTTVGTRAVVNTGKEISNPLIANSLLKIIRLSMHLVIAMKH